MDIFTCDCDSNKFIVVENFSYKAEVGDDGVLCCGLPAGGIDYIECAECGQRFSECFFSYIIF